jgi:hypothetical protein
VTALELSSQVICLNLSFLPVLSAWQPPFLPEVGSLPVELPSSLHQTHVINLPHLIRGPLTGLPKSIDSNFLDQTFPNGFSSLVLC